MFLHQRIEVLIGLLQQASIVWSAKQAANAVGVEALTQPFGKRLRQAFQDLADAKPLREQPANSVHRAVTATIHADLRSRKGAPHRLGLIDMNVAIGLDAVRQTRVGVSRGGVHRRERRGPGCPAAEAAAEKRLAQGVIANAGFRYDGYRRSNGSVEQT